MDYPKFIVSVQKEESISIQMVKTPKHHVGITILWLQSLDSQERLNILDPDTAPMILEDFSKISLFFKMAARFKYSSKICYHTFGLVQRD